MPLYTAEAIVLRTYKLGEADRIVVFLTRDRGKKRGVARGARRTASRFVGALEPMTRARVAYFEKEQRELVSLNYAEPLRSPLSAAAPDGLSYVGYFADLLDQCAPDADPDERLFRLGAAVGEGLAAGVSSTVLARYFEVWLLRFQGVYPSLSACHACGGSLERDGAYLSSARVFVCARCQQVAEPADLSPAAVALVRRVATLPPERLVEVCPPGDVLREVERVHRALVVAHLEREPRSGRVLRELEAS
jgi:DNA repair protein RecO (recombination protein O)